MEENESQSQLKLDPQKGCSWDIIEGEPSVGVKRKKAEDSDSPLNRSRESLF